MGAPCSADIQRMINEIPDPTTRRVVQTLVAHILAEIATKADAAD